MVEDIILPETETIYKLTLVYYIYFSKPAMSIDSHVGKIRSTKFLVKYHLNDYFQYYVILFAKKKVYRKQRVNYLITSIISN